MHTAEVPMPEVVGGPEQAPLPRVVTSTSALLSAFEVGLEVQPVTVVDKAGRSETLPAIFWRGERLTYHREQAVLPETHQDLELAASIAGQTRSLVATARGVAEAQKLATYYKDHGQLPRAAVAKAKEAALRAQLKLQEMELNNLENKVSPWNLVPYHAVAELRDKIELLREHGQPVTRDWYEATRDRLLTEYSPRPKSSRAKTGLQPARGADRGGVTFIGLGSAGLPDLEAPTPASHVARVDKRVATALKVGVGITALAEFMSLPACTAATPVPAEATPVAPEPTATAETVPTAPGVEKTPTGFVEQGPEATPSPAAVYPSSLSVEQLNGGLASGGELPAGFMDNSEVQRIYELRKAWLRQSGFNVDDPNQDNYVTVDVVTWGQGDSFRWEVVGKDETGNLVGWLQIADPSIQTGWRYADRPSWDSRFDPTSDSFRFGLPDKLDPQNRFVIASLIGGGQDARILVEVDQAGNPLRWLNVAAQKMRSVLGAPEPLTSLPGNEVISEYLKGGKVMSREEFTGGVDPRLWNVGEGVTAANGQVEIQGKQWSSFLDLKEPLKENQAVVANFKYASGSYFDLKIHSGEFGTDGYKRFGVYVGVDGQFYVNVFQGTKYEQAIAIPGLVTKPDTWYSLMIVVSPEGKLSLVAWDPANPSQRLVYEWIWPGLAGTKWNFSVGADKGAINLDNVAVLSFDSYETPPPPTAQPKPTQAPVTPRPTTGAQATSTPQGPEATKPPVTTEGWFFDQGRNRWVCQGCAFNLDLINTNPKNLAFVAYDYAAGVRTRSEQFLSPERFMELYNEYTGTGYKPAFMTMTQNPEDGDPRDGVDRLSLVIYTMHLNNPNLP